MKRRLISTIAAIAMAASLLAWPASGAFAAQDASTVSPGSTVDVPLAVPSSGNTGITNVFKAKLDYDPEVFEDPGIGSFSLANPWTSPRYNPATREFVVVSKASAAPGSTVGTLSLKVKDGAKVGAAAVQLLEMELSNGGRDIAAEPIAYSLIVSNLPGGVGGVPGALGDYQPTAKTGSGASLAKTGSRTPEMALLALAAVAILAMVVSLRKGLAADADPGIGLVPNSRVSGICPVSRPREKCSSRDRACEAAQSSAHRKKRSASSRFTVPIIVTVALLIFPVQAAVSHAPAHADPYVSRYDLNGDGIVNDADVYMLEGILIHLEEHHPVADLNGDGNATVSDLSLMAAYRYSLPDVQQPEPVEPGVGEGENPAGPEVGGGKQPGDDPATPGTGDGPATPGEGEGDDPATPGEDGGENGDSAGPDGEGENDDPADPGGEGENDDPAVPNEGEGGDPDNPDDPDDPEEFPQVTPQDLPVTYEEIQMRTDAMKARGIYGDHSQWPTGLEVSHDGALMLVGTDCAGIYRSLDGGATWEQANYGFDYRSTCSFAIDPHNSSHALVIGGARNGDGLKFGGIYQTFDAGASWTQVENVIRVFGNRFDWDCFEFDPTTYDASSGITTDVYLSTPWLRDVDIREKASERDTVPDGKMTAAQAGLYKSTDGGATYTQLSSNVYLTDGIIKFASEGTMFIGNEYGLFEVNKETGEIESAYFENYDIDGTTPMKDWNGVSINVLNFNMGVTGLDLVNDTLYVQTWDGIYTKKLGETDSGEEPDLGEEASASGEGEASEQDDGFDMIESDNYSKLWPQFVSVSPANPDHMVMTAKRRITAYYDNYLYYSRDGGHHWTQSAHDPETMFSEPGAWNSIERLIAWDPFDPEKVTVNGNGTITQSTDGGAAFVQTNGISNLMAGGKICLNYYNPEIITLGAQDFTGVISTNGGDTWRQLRASKDGDQTRSLYGAFSPDGQTIVAWGRNKYATPFSLMTSFDGGSTWIDTGLVSDVDVSHSMAVLQSYNDPDILLADEYRSTDGGHTWEPMDGCLCAYTINYTGRHEIYGGNAQGKPVVSYDDGASWQVLYDGDVSKFWALVPGTERIQDLAYDHVNNILYILDRFSTQYSEGASINPGKCTVVKMPLDDPSSRKDLNIEYVAGYSGIRSIAVDPNSTGVLYVAGSGDSCVNPTGLMRSIDGGETFSNLTCNDFTYTTDKGKVVKVETKATNQGGYEANQVRVDPRTGRVVIGTNCYGFETINPPYDPSLLKR